MTLAVDVAAELARDPFATALARALVERATPAVAALGDGLWGTVAVVADGAVLSLRFDFGRVTLHRGYVGRAAVTVSGTRAQLERFFSLGSQETEPAVRFRFGGELGRRLTRATTRAAQARWRGEPRVYGALRHPGFMVRVLALFEH